VERGHTDTVQRGVELGGSQCDGVDVVREHLNRACASRRDRDKPAPRGKVEHAAAMHQLGMVEHVTSERGAASPRERPVRQRNAVTLEVALSGLPEPERVVRLVQSQLRDERHEVDSRMRAHKLERIEWGAIARHEMR